MVTRSLDVSVPDTAAALEAGDWLHALAAELAAAAQPEDVLASTTRALASLFSVAVCAAAAFDPIDARWIIQTGHAGSTAAGSNRAEETCVPAPHWPHAFAGKVHRYLQRMLPAPRRDDTIGMPLDDLALLSLAPSPEAILTVALGAVGGCAGLLLIVWPVAPAAAVRASAQQHLTVVAGMAELALLALTHRRRLEALQADSAEHDAFISLLAHDLRTPLTAIRGYAQLLARQARRQAASPMVGGLEVIIQQADQLGLLTELLLDVTRIRTGRLALDRRPLDLGALLRQELASLAEDLRASVILDAPESGPVVDGDRRRLAQALQALLGFTAARVASPGGSGSGLRCELTVEEEAAHLTLEDGGPPLDARTQAMLFVRLPAPAGFSRQPVLPAIDLYHQAHLFVARGVIEAHHGRIHLQSPVPEQDVGAQVHIWLPLATPH